MKKFLFLALAAIVAVSCSKEDDGPKNIEVTGGQINQTVYADDATISGNGINFTTTGPWTSSISGSAKSAADQAILDWISISPDHGDVAGHYTINITMDNNTSGADRKAIITIACGGETITITVTQKGTTAGGEVPEKQKLISAITGKLTSKQSDYDYAANGLEFYSYEFEYDDQNRLKEYIVLAPDKSVYEKYTLSYNVQNQIRISDKEGSTVATAKLDAQKRMTELSGTSLVYDRNYTYTDGMISTIIADYEFGEGNEFTWMSGNLTKSIHWENYSYKGSEWSDPSINIFEYSAQTNDKTNLDLNFLLGFNPDTYGYPECSVENILFMAGFGGKRSVNMGIGFESDDESAFANKDEIYSGSNLPATGDKRISFYDSRDGNGNYTMDSKGYPLTFSHNIKVTKEVFTYNGVKTQVYPAEMHMDETGMIHRYGEGPWYRITRDLTTTEATDKYTFTISYK